MMSCIVSNMIVDDTPSYPCVIVVFSLRDRAQVEQLLRYIVEEPHEDAESKRTFKYSSDLTKNFSFFFNMFKCPYSKLFQVSLGFVSDLVILFHDLGSRSLLVRFSHVKLT